MLRSCIRATVETTHNWSHPSADLDVRQLDNTVNTQKETTTSLQTISAGPPQKMAEEKAIEHEAAADGLERRSTSSTADERISNDSSSADDVAPGSEKQIGDKASYAAIRPAVTNTSAAAPARSLAPTRSLPSIRSLRSLAHARSHNGHGCDDLDDEEESDDPALFSSPSSSDPEGTGAGAQSSRSRAAKDPFEVTFERGNDDPWNPRSMPTPRKWLITTLASSGSFCVTCASSIYTSTYTQMNAEFGCSDIVATLGLSTFVLGIALGPMWSPLSEFYGRRPIYLAAFAVFAIWIIPCAVATNIETVIVARFFQGLSGSAFLSVSGGTVSDLFTPEKMHHPLTLFTAAPFLGPSVGPLIGGFINSNVNWRWTHYVMIIWAFCMFLAICFLIPETYHPVILRKKAQKKRKETGDERWKAAIEKTNKSFLRTVGYALLRPFEILLFEPMALILDLYSAILLGILYLFFGAFPTVFEGAFNFNLWQTGLTFLGMLVGMLAGAMSSSTWQKVRARLIKKNEKVTGVEGKSEPEFRLPQVMAGSVFVTIGLFWFAWTTFSWVHWILPIIGSGIFGMGTLLAFSGTFAYLVETYPRYAASALAANAFVRCAFAAAFPLFGTQMYKKLGDQWATSLLAFLTLAMLPFPVLFFRYGKGIRAHSRMAATG